MTNLYPERDNNHQDKKGHLGLIHIFYGQGVGKTTRSIGLAIRAAGAGLNVQFVQFMKSGDSGEVEIFNRIDNIHYRCPGKHSYILNLKPDEVHFEHARLGLEFAWEAFHQKPDFLICDEILNAVFFGLLPLEEVLKLAEACRGKIEFLMTGSDAHQDLVAIADYVTRVHQEKHPYYFGIQARRGVEF